MSWHQREIELPEFGPGLHLVTRYVVDALPELAYLRVGLLHIFVRHTSASLTINENADPDVLIDLDRVLNVLAKEDFSYRHTVEGPDDMPAHVKASLMGSSLTVPVTSGCLRLGTWQGIYLCEHRRAAHRRRLLLTLQGESD